MSNPQRGFVIRILSGASLLAVSVLVAPAATAETIFFGPTPYLSAADSPFDLSGLGTTMFLEDFEDGELNTPGVSTGLISPRILTPSVVTNSVDADDGAIDGWGSDGHSMAHNSTVCHDTDPPHCTSSVRLLFASDELGWLPTAVGIVWTDGISLDSFGFGAIDSEGNSISPGVVAVGLGDGDSAGGTTEDRFFGVIHESGISEIFLSAGPVGGGFQVDHLQYGLVIPEPSSRCLILWSGPLVAGMFVVRGQSGRMGTASEKVMKLS